jgi:hypothetical protein
MKLIFVTFLEQKLVKSIFNKFWHDSNIEVISVMVKLLNFVKVKDSIGLSLNKSFNDLTSLSNTIFILSIFLTLGIIFPFNSFLSFFKNM